MSHTEEIALLRRELEILMNERQALLRVVGASAAMIAGLDTQQMPVPILESADLLSLSINALPEETLKDALESVHAHPIA